MTVGEKLLSLRKKKGLSQEEAANILNVSRQTISKWETDSSTPDFDKIVPICELYEISANELLNTNKDESSLSINNEIQDNNIKNKSARNISISVALYIISVVFIVGFSTIGQDILGLCMFFIVVAIATGIIVYNVIINKKTKKELTKDEKLVKNINEVISIMIVIIYFIVSFLTMAWHITWVLFLVNGLLEEIVKLIFSIKRGDSNE